MADYTLNVTLDLPIDQAEERVRDALAAQGFGILSEIDVRATLREKLDQDVGPYRILGACNPPLAHRAIGLDANVGALLPCNVLLRGVGDEATEVAAADPLAMLDVAGGELDDVAREARERLDRALATLATGGPDAAA